MDAELKQLGYDAAEHEKLRLQEQSGRSSQERLSQLEKAKAALVPLERELQDLENAINQAESHLDVVQKEYREANAKLVELTAGSPNLDSLEREYYTMQEQVNKLLTEVGYARNQVDVLARQKVQKETRLEEKTFINHNIANLKILEKAFGKDGIPALLIEQSLPEIETHANEILDRLSSGNMSVKFETQREFRDKKREDRKETLDILIRDAAGEREYELFSGGEAFRINFAIRLALSRVLSNRAGARLQTLVIDEGFGSQDSDGRQRLIEAINLVQSDFAKILVITHLEELKDAFPARIDVVKTQYRFPGERGGGMTIIEARVALQQRVLPEYRAPFFNLLGQSCIGGLEVFAGLPRTQEAIATSSQLTSARFVRARNMHLFSGKTYSCIQRGFIHWLETWQPQVLIVEANPRYLSTPLAIQWMHHRQLPVIGWGLGAPKTGRAETCIRARIPAQPGCDHCLFSDWR